jgi:ESX-1-secreted protein regulator
VTDTSPAPPGPEGESLAALADRLNWLVERVHPPGRGRYSNYEIAELIAKVTGESVSHNAIWKLRNGQSANPTMRLVSALAQVFGVPPGYFYGQQPLPDEQAEMLTLIRDTGITAAELRAFATLTPAGRRAVADLIAATTAPDPPPARRGRGESRG